MRNPGVAAVHPVVGLLGTTLHQAHVQRGLAAVRRHLEHIVVPRLDRTRLDRLHPPHERAHQALERRRAGDAHGQVLAGNIQALPPQVGVFEWGTGKPHTDRLRGRLRGKGVLLGDNYLYVGWSTHQLHEMEEFIAVSFIWGSIAAIAVALAGGAIMSGRLVRKIETVSATSRNIIQGDLTQRVPIAHAGDDFDRAHTAWHARIAA